MLELVTAYVPFANGGIAVIPHVVERVRTAHDGKVLYARNPTPLGRVVDARYVAMMTAMMRETSPPGPRARQIFPAGRQRARPARVRISAMPWFVGYTSQLVTGVWLGNDDNAPTRKITGGSLPVEVWSAVMKFAHKGKVPGDLPGNFETVAGDGEGLLPPDPIPVQGPRRLFALPRARLTAGSSNGCSPAADCEVADFSAIQQKVTFLPLRLCLSSV